MAKSLGKLTRDQVVERARSAIGRPTAYKLGAGGRIPQLALPELTLDCSGFAAWVMGIDRYLPNGAIPHLPGGDWFSCSNIYADAQSPYGYASEVPWKSALPGDVLVWPDKDGEIGHIGIISQVGDKGPTAVIHCSAGNFRRRGDAIQETTTALFVDFGAIAAHIQWVED